jgi:ribonuclease HI
VKLNCDGSSVGAHPCGAVGIVIRDSNMVFLGALTSNIGYATPIEAEFCACMLAIEKAMDMSLTNICLETDSLKVVTAYHKAVGVPWQMRARWHNCMTYCSRICCTCVHTLREGNMVADALARNGQGLSMYSTQWWPSPPSFLQPLLSRDSLGLPFSRLNLS